MEHSILTHNGCITVRNRTTSEHRTFRIRTQPKDAKFAPGERVVSLMTGTENDNDKSFKGFGFVKTDRIVLWKKNITDTFTSYANMLMYPERYEDRYEYLFETTCRVCNRKLTEPESIKTGIGPVCAGRIPAPKPATEKELDQMERWEYEEHASGK